MQSHDRVEFFCPGTARPKGSHRGFVVAGRVVMAPASAGERGWRESVANAARAAMQGMQPLMGPVQVLLEFYSLRPKSHFRKPKRGEFICPHGTECVHRCPQPLRPGAQVRPTAKPDGDKLWRSVGDALNGVCYRDDAQVCEATIRKRYTRPDQPYCGVRVVVESFKGEG